MNSPKTPGEEIQLDFTGNIHNKNLSSTTYILIAVDKNSRWPVTKICKNTNHETATTFLEEYLNVYAVPEHIKSDKREAQNISRIYGTANLHTGTGLVERTTQSEKNLILANL